MNISNGDENAGQSIRAERLTELVDIAGADNVTDILVAVSKDKFPDVRMAAAKAMGLVKNSRDKVTKSLQDALVDSHPGVRLAAISSLIQNKTFPIDKDSVIANLAIGINSSNWDLSGYLPKADIEKEKNSAISGNCTGTGSKSNGCLLDIIRGDIRKGAIRELAKIVSKSTKAKETLEKLKRDKNPSIRTLAKEELEKNIAE